MDSWLLKIAVGVLVWGGLSSPAAAQFSAPPQWSTTNWYRGGTTLDLDFVNDRYNLNGTLYPSSGNCTSLAATLSSNCVSAFITGAGATFTRSGTTNVTAYTTPFYIDTTQGQAFVSRAGAVATYFDSSGTLQTASANTARTNYTYNGSSWVNSGTLIEPAATNNIRNNTMAGAAAGAAITPQTITSITASGTTATVTTASAHGLTNSPSVTISGTTPSNFSGTFGVTSIPNSTTFTYNMLTAPGGNASVVGSYTASTYGTSPTYWGGFGNGTGVGFTTVGTGTENGINYIEYHAEGVSTGSIIIWGALEGTGTQIPAAFGQTWTFSCYLKLVSGSFSNVPGMNLYFKQWKSGGIPSIDQFGSGFVPTSGALGTTKYTYTAALTDPSAAYITPNIIFFISAGYVNFNIRVGMPQLEQSTYATSVIATSSAAVTRSTDIYSVPNGGTYYNSSGVLKQAPVNTPRLDYGSTGGAYPKGLLIEMTRTNGIRNNMMVGAVASVALTAQTISSITNSTTTATMTTASAHGLAVGNIVTIVGASPSNYNGTFSVATVPSSTTFTYTMVTDPGANATTVGSYTARTGGTMPTRWSGPFSGGGSGYYLTTTVVGTGTENGISYVDLRIQGTAVSGNFWYFFFESSTQIAAAQNQTWAESAYFKLASGSSSGFSLRFDIKEINSGGASIADSYTGITAPTSSSLASQYSSAVYTLANATTAYVSPTVLTGFPVGAIDATIRIGMPQMENAFGALEVASSVIPTFNSAVSRDYEYFSLPTTATGANGQWYSSASPAVGTLIGVGVKPNSDSFPSVTALDDGSANNSIYNYLQNSPGVEWGAVTTSGTAVYSYNNWPTSYTGGNVFKGAVAYATNNVRGASGGVLDTLGTSVTIPTVTTLRIGTGPNRGFPWNGWINRITYFNDREPDAAIQDYTR